MVFVHFEQIISEVDFIVWWDNSQCLCIDATRCSECLCSVGRVGLLIRKMVWNPFLCFRLWISFEDFRNPISQWMITSCHFSYFSSGVKLLFYLRQGQSRMDYLKSFLDLLTLFVNLFNSRKESNFKQNIQIFLTKNRVYFHKTERQKLNNTLP